jgi:hypothetical protein
MVSPLTANVTLDMYRKYSLSSQIHQLFEIILKQVMYNTALCFVYYTTISVRYLPNT